MTSYRQGQDVWLYPVVVPTSCSIAWTETAGDQVASVPAGTYWAYAGATLPGYPSLLNALAAAMSAASAFAGDVVTYSSRALTPIHSPEQTWAGIALVGSSADFLSLDLDNTHELLRKVLGFDAALTATISTVVGTTSARREVQGRFTRWGAWLSPAPASSRMRSPRRLIEWATEYTERDDAYAVDHGDRSTREWVYEWILGGHVFSALALDIQYADAAGLAVGDVYNAFEDVWRALAQLDEVVVIHHNEGDAVDLAVITHAYDVVRLANRDQARDFRRVAELLRTAGEYYKLTVECAIRVSGDGY
jgi:hypothetical protein